MSPPIPPGAPGWKCPRRVGFLFPHDCRRETPVGCPDCQNGQIEDPYAGRRDRYGYSRYDYYDDSYYFGYGLYQGSQPSSDAAASDFTEADGADLVQTDADSGDLAADSFENDMTES